MQHVNTDQTFSTSAECTGSNGLVFHALQNQFLVLKDTTNPLVPIFKICKYAGSSSAITLNDVGDESRIYAELKSNTASASTWIIKSFN